MSHSRILMRVAATVPLLVWDRSLPAADLTFEDRIRAQAAIDRVYYSHQTGTTRAFEDIVTRNIVERQVRRYLEQSVALEEFWNTPLTSAMLRRELERMASQSRMPERLRELYRALDDDPLLIQECLARPALVDRLSRSFFAYDAAIHAAERAMAEKLSADLGAGALNPRVASSGRTVMDVVLAAASARLRSPTGTRAGRAGKDSTVLELGASEFERFRAHLPRHAGDVGAVEEEREAFVVRVVLEIEEGRVRVASFVVPKRTFDEWLIEIAPRLDVERIEPLIVSDAALPRAASAVAASGQACLVDDAWDNGSLDDVPDPRAPQVWVWTGSVLMVWGGSAGTFLNSGGRYDPATDTWTSISTIGGPSARGNHTAVWTGNVMVIWGGDDGGPPFNDGGRYDPATDTWSPVSLSGAPAARFGHSAVWTGVTMIVWGGAGQLISNDGGRYDPVMDTWSGISTLGAPSPRISHSAVWTGQYMVVWGGDNGMVQLGTGGRYDPASDSWIATSTINSPAPRAGHTAVWTGRSMIVWGGGNVRTFAYVNSGSRYDPSTNTWTPTSLINAPSPRAYHSAVWTGSYMVVWGGDLGNSSFVQTGARYDPASNLWVPTSTTNAPTSRASHAAAWTGSLMVVWGGVTLGSFLDTGGRYDPITDTWTPTYTLSASPRYRHTAVWTGSVMVVWGGASGAGFLASGDRYDPATDTWTPTTTINAPVPRILHTAVWTGNLMLVWGGYNSSALNTGGRYDPLSDTWAPIFTVDAPPARYSHTAVWAAERMVVWGGHGLFFLNTGGRYDPTTDTWAPTSLINTPSPRSNHSAVSTGNLVIVWGGYNDSAPFDSGGLYDPATDMWSDTAPDGAPSRRYDHTALWTGRLMLVWGGFDFNELGTGGQYDPFTGTWTPIPVDGAIPPRSGHTAVWTGDLMVIWGGGAYIGVNSGGQYSPRSDAWTPTTSSNAPSPRRFQTAVWADDFMIVWGGQEFHGVRTGGRFIPGQPVDLDGDGYGACFGDCNDGDPSIHPEAIELCDGIDNDCNGTSDDAPEPTELPFLNVTGSFTSTQLSWSHVIDTTGYDVVSGDLRVLIDTGGDFTQATAACLADDLSATVLVTDDLPPPGVGFWYVVRAVNCRTNGSYDSDGQGQIASRDGGINASPLGCP